MRPRSQACSSAVARPKSARTALGRAVPRAGARRWRRCASNAASTSSTVRVGLVGRVGQALSPRQPTPMRRCGSTPDRWAVTTSTTSGRPAPPAKAGGQRLDLRGAGRGGGDGLRGGDDVGELHDVILPRPTDTQPSKGHVCRLPSRGPGACGPLAAARREATGRGSGHGTRFTPWVTSSAAPADLVRTVALSAATAAGAVAVVARTTPWPSALVIRAVFDRGAARSSAALARHVPGDLVEIVDEAYDTRRPTG